MSNRAHDPIPRFVIPETYSDDRDRNYRAFRSPEDGAIVQILDDLWHADRIEEWMRGDGERISLEDFQEVALDPPTYPEYDDKPNGYDLRVNMAGAAFNAVLNPIISEALEVGWGLVRSNPTAYRDQVNVFRPYYSWSRNQWRRRQFLVSTQSAFQTYDALKHSDDPRKRRLKFLRTFDVMFDAEPPDDEPPAPTEEDHEK